MDHTYAEIGDTFGTVPTKTMSSHFTTPKSRRHMRRDQFDSRLPIEFRYPRRNSLTSSVSTKKRSLASKSSSSGYSSSGSASSITTVVNGAKPYRPKKGHTGEHERQFRSEEDTSMVNKVPESESGEEEEKTPDRPKACCIECREEEIRRELDLESHQYANLETVQKPQNPYVFLMTSMLTGLQKEDKRRVVKVQQKIEKVLRLKPREPFNVEHKPSFDRQVSSFGADVSIRLRAVSDMAPDTYRDVSAKFCEALHHGTPNSKGLKGIVKGMKSLLNF